MSVILACAIAAFSLVAIVLIVVAIKMINHSRSSDFSTHATTYEIKLPSPTPEKQYCDVPPDQKKQYCDEPPKSANVQPFDAGYFWTSCRRVKNFNYSQLNETEKKIFDDIFAYLNDVNYEGEEVIIPSEARHITLNRRLDTLDFNIKEEDEDTLYHVIFDHDNWECLDDDTFWLEFGQGESEMVFTPPAY